VICERWLQVEPSEKEGKVNEGGGKRTGRELGGRGKFIECGGSLERHALERVERREVRIQRSACSQMKGKNERGPGKQDA